MLIRSKTFACTLQAEKAVWSKTVQERTKNVSSEESQVARAFDIAPTS